ncbi:hypothetical protein Tco_0584247 [Tanacetum coccineum]
MDVGRHSYFDSMLPTWATYRISGFSCEKTPTWERTLQNDTSLICIDIPYFVLLPVSEDEFGTLIPYSLEHMHRHVIHHLEGYLFRDPFVELDSGDTVSRNVLILGIPSPFVIVIVVRVAAVRITICQERYTRNLLKKYEISDSSSVKTPMVPPNNLGSDLVVKPASLKESHLTTVKRIFRYLKGTPSLGLWYPKCYGFDLKGYSDSDYDGCHMDRKSTLSACLILRGKLVCWNAKKQQSVAMSSVEAEYVAVARCCANILWMKSQQSDYDIHYKMVPIFCDNTSAIAISNNHVLHSRTKHINIRYHFIRDYILKGDIELHFIPTEYQLADFFTKPLDEPTFTRLKAKLGMLNID